MLATKVWPPLAVALIIYGARVIYASHSARSWWLVLLVGVVLALFVQRVLVRRASRRTPPPEH